LLRDAPLGIKGLKLQLNVFNLLNREEVTSISPGKVLVGDQYQFQAPRSLQVSAKADF
jgi:outer membrane receptor protein involved in Fe transport